MTAVDGFSRRVVIRDENGFHTDSTCGSLAVFGENVRLRGVFQSYSEVRGTIITQTTTFTS